MSEFKTIDYEDGLMDDLRDPVFAVQYLNACLEEEVDDPGERKKMVLSALGQVMKAHGLSKLARETHLNRGNLYESIIKEKNTRLDTLFKVLEALHIRLKFEIV
jgi:probable addiction module antidote protein